MKLSCDQCGEFSSCDVRNRVTHRVGHQAIEAANISMAAGWGVMATSSGVDL